MNVSFKSWELTTDHTASSYGQPVLVNRTTKDAYGAGDIVQAYPSWGFTLAADAVRRMAATAELTPDQTNIVNRFCATLKV